MLSLPLWLYVAIYFVGFIITYFCTRAMTKNDAPTWARFVVRTTLPVTSWLFLVFIFFLLLQDKAEDKLNRKLVPNWLKWL